VKCGIIRNGVQGTGRIDSFPNTPPAEVISVFYHIFLTGQRYVRAGAYCSRIWGVSAAVAVKCHGVFGEVKAAEKVIHAIVGTIDVVVAPDDRNQGNCGYDGDDSYVHNRFFHKSSVLIIYHTIF